MADEVVVSILQTTDIHGFLTRSAPSDGPGGGWLRLATIIRQQRAARGPENVLLVDCGDTAFGCVETVPSRGMVVTRLLESLRYDVWVPGNHELDMGGIHCAKLCSWAGQKVVCGNLGLLGAAGTHDVNFPSWRLFHKGGARIAVIGMTASYTKNWIWGENGANFRAWSAEQAIADCIAAVRRSSPHLIVLAIHQGWLPNDHRGVNEVAAIVGKFPEIDIVLGGHTHWPHAGRSIGHRAWYVQGGAHATSLAVVNATIDLDEGRLIGVESELLEASPNIPIDPESREAIGNFLADAAEFEKRPVGVLAAPLAAGRRVGVDSDTCELICRAIAAATGTEVVIHGRLSGSSFPAGVFTESDLFDLVPYENRLGTLKLTPSQLKAVLEEQIAMRRSYVANGIWGLEVDIDQDDRVVAMRTAEGVVPNRPIEVAFNSYTLAGGGGRFPVLKRLVEEGEVSLSANGSSTRQVVREYIRKNSPVTIQAVPHFLFDPGPGKDGGI